MSATGFANKIPSWVGTAGVEDIQRTPQGLAGDCPSPGKKIQTQMGSG